MKVARLHAVGDLRLADEAVPEPGPGMSLVRVSAVGICVSDLHWWGEAGIGDATLSHPLVLGHEAAGVIEDGPRRGERVAIDPAISCCAGNTSRMRGVSTLAQAADPSVGVRGWAAIGTRPAPLDPGAPSPRPRR